MKRIEYKVKMRIGTNTRPMWMVADTATNEKDATAIMKEHERCHPSSTFRLDKVTTETLTQTPAK